MRSRRAAADGDLPDHTDWEIVDVLRRLGYVGPVPKGGGGWRPVRCPFHPDRSASASVSTAVNGFRCHSCDAAGNPVTLVMQQLGLSAREACDWLGGASGGAPARQAGLVRTGEWWRNLP